MDFLHRRLSLIRALSDAGGRLVAILAVLLLGQALLPTAVAIGVGLLIGGIEIPSPPGGTAVWLPFALLIGLLIAGHGIDSLTRPFVDLAKARINGAHRARLAALVSSTATIEVLESPETQDLLRLAAADPQNWTERTPGDGAVAQLGLVMRYASAVAACAVVATYSIWATPALAVAALVGREIRRRQWLAINRLWASGVQHGRQATYWQEVITAPSTAKEVQVFGFADWAIARIQRQVHAMFDPAWGLGLKVQYQQVVPWAVTVAPLALVYGFLASSVVHGDTTVAAEAAVLSACWSVYMAVAGISDAFDIEGTAPVLAAYARLRKLLGTSHALQADGRPSATTAAPVIDLREVGFTYPGSERAVLDGLNLRIEPGERLAIVGLNGAGKSTLIKLLAGLYRPTSGRVTIDGVELADLDVRQWRSRIAVVFQDFIRYHLPTIDNVVLTTAAAPPNRSALDAAATEAGLDKVIETLPSGWDTPLARDRHGGVDLSGGQWQHVALARALYAVHNGATLLILDEPTAHLDVRTEAELFGRLIRRPRDASVVLISHRLSTVQHSDRIIVLDAGRITESGTHDELIELDGQYSKMFRIQAKRFAEGYDDRADEVATG